jgi:hypothetical protein
MQRYYDTVTDQRGNALAGARVAVQSGGTNVAIYSDDGVTLKTNPMTTDASGGFSFYAANGTYDLVVTSASGVVSSLPSRVRLFDVADSGLATSAALAASSGAALVGQGSGTVADALLLSWAYAQSFQLVSATRNSDSAITTATIVWPDGTAGVFTADTLSTEFPGAIDAWHATYAGTTAKTVTQTAVTRDSNGAVTAQPAITIA